MKLFLLTSFKHMVPSQSSLLQSVAQAATHSACNQVSMCAWHLQFRYIVDGVWKWAEDEPAVRDDEGNYINVMEVHEYVPENLESLSGFEPPASPPSRCVSHVHA